jgi:hypothetical protein
LEAAKEAVEAGRRLVRQLLDVTRAEETRAEYVDINDFLSYSTSSFRAWSPGVALEFAV